ncbi:MAG: hypothetical protein WAL32_11880 [Terriglobales bacterium]
MSCDTAYDTLMAKAKKFDLEAPAPVFDEEDEETLAAIDEGIRDAESGRVGPAEKARELLPKRTTASPTRKRRPNSPPPPSLPNPDEPASSMPFPALTLVCPWAWVREVNAIAESGQ